jgi:hypothetical protein
LRPNQHYSPTALGRHSRHGKVELADRLPRILLLDAGASVAVAADEGFAASAHRTRWFCRVTCPARTHGQCSKPVGFDVLQDGPSSTVATGKSR